MAGLGDGPGFGLHAGNALVVLVGGDQCCSCSVGNGGASGGTTGHLAQEGVQVLLTSQSPVVLDEMDPEEVLHARREKGEAVYECMADFERVSRKEGGMKPGAMWLAGYLGEGLEEGS
ncbi:hypothetical protein [Chondromyces apiculatus]|uniref:Uncharacterized protein n=1 Tax=Chondromyces apiculatus DSM 436 TaxID=1192034 RepID=A0A017THG3_9BACT|nr:hypothetical protein [Chondromyces apiculatus]EYF08684.1 Hypothetical protein CAP_2545 [Chondromyces apiculatus DSM 436]